MTEKASTPLPGVAGFVVLVVILGATEKFRGDFIELLGFWGGLIGATLFTAILVFGICLVVKVPWRKALAFALMIPLILNTFEGTLTALEPRLGSISAFSVGGVTAVTLGLLVGFLATRILRINWDGGHADTRV
ncbi:MAG: hypothetical protein AAF802_19260 [Planctomycetota bacterium]